MLGAPELARFRARLRERLARGRPLRGSMTLRELGEAETEALFRLLGRAPRPGRRSSSVSLDELEARLREAGVSPSLREAVELLEGPVLDRRGAREKSNAEWARVIDEARLDPACSPPLATWLDGIVATGLLKRLSGGRPSAGAGLLRAVLQVASALPGAGIPLAALAAERLGDAHALDPGSPTASLAVRAAAALGGVGFRDTAEGRRSAWAGAGVLSDEVSTPVLVLDLPASGEGLLARWLREAAAAGEPLHVSLRLLLRHPLDRDPGFRGLDVFVCENPTIVALAAGRLGAGCRPLVCVNGQPATPQQVLLRQLAAAGARLRYHGDFDCGGLRIARHVIERFGARPWRMGEADYLAAAASGRPLERDPTASPWDPRLAAAMARERRAVHEELVAETLLADLEACAAWIDDGSTIE